MLLIVEFRIQYKAFVITYQALNGDDREYIYESLPLCSHFKCIRSASQYIRDVSSTLKWKDYYPAVYCEALCNFFFWKMLNE